MVDLSTMNLVIFHNFAVEDSVLRYDAVSYAMRSTKYEPSSMLTYFHGLLGIANIAMCSNMATVLVECTMEDQ